ncbi:MAG: hypothetical protein HY899_06980 [Deltaproteobacteria bacterium]|nr:hypothetical protein [Deltaproteobacteria bacterium]
MGFSLGCRPLLHALADCAVLPENLRCIAFVGAAAPRHLYERLPRRFLTEGRGRIIHVWSKNDGVLSLLYPLVQGAYPAAGAAPVNVPGIRDVEFDVGHTGYGAVASELVRVVTESHLAGRSKAPA